MWRALFFLTNPIVALTLSFFVLGRVSGWFSLANKFPQMTDYQSDWETFQSVSLQGISFNRCLSIGVSTKALFLKPCFPLSYVFSPLEIPWTDIASVKRSENFWSKNIHLRIDDPKVMLTLKEQQLRRALPYVALDAT
jgi:hypothetical protein